MGEAGSRDQRHVVPTVQPCQQRIPGRRLPRHQRRRCVGAVGQQVGRGIGRQPRRERRALGCDAVDRSVRQAGQRHRRGPDDAVLGRPLGRHRIGERRRRHDQCRARRSAHRPVIQSHLPAVTVRRHRNAVVEALHLAVGGRHVEGGDGCRGRDRVLQRRRNPLGPLQRTQQIAAREAGDIGVAPAALHQLGEQRRIGRHVLQPRRRLRNPVQIATKANMVVTRHFGDIVDMVGDHGQRHRWLRMRLVPFRQRCCGALRLADIEATERRRAEAGFGTRPRRFPGIAFGGNIGRRVVDHHHAAVRGEQFQYVVGDVARVIVDGARR